MTIELFPELCIPWNNNGQDSGIISCVHDKMNTIAVEAIALIVAYLPIIIVVYHL